MDPFAKALWYVESRLDSAFSLDDVADHAGVSPEHLTRMFAASTGRSLMRYVRLRRLTKAALTLATQRTASVLEVALGAGYGSNEAFTRAFRAHFGITPEAVRAGARLQQSHLEEPIDMASQPAIDLRPPRFADVGAMRLVGIARRYTQDHMAEIPGQWQMLAPHFGQIPGARGNAAWGACYDTGPDATFTYLCGVEVEPRSSDFPEGFAVLDVPAARFAQFRHPGHITEIRRVFTTIFSTWLPASGYALGAAPILERYGAKFDPVTGNGGFECWLPVRTP